MDTYGQISQYASQGHITAESLARPTRLRFKVMVSGIGQTKLTGAKGINFGAFLLEEPSFVFGMVADGAIANVPLGSAMVLGWKTDGKFWTGADLGFVIESDVPIKAAFSLIFEGTSLRITPTTSLGLG